MVLCKIICWLCFSRFLCSFLWHYCVHKIAYSYIYIHVYTFQYMHIVFVLFPKPDMLFGCFSENCNLWLAVYHCQCVLRTSAFTVLIYSHRIPCFVLYNPSTLAGIKVCQTYHITEKSGRKSHTKNMLGTQSWCTLVV